MFIKVQVDEATVGLQARKLPGNQLYLISNVLVEMNRAFFQRGIFWGNCAGIGDRH